VEEDNYKAAKNEAKILKEKIEELNWKQREVIKEIITDGLCLDCWGPTPCYCMRDD